MTNLQLTAKLYFFKTLINKKIRYTLRNITVQNHIKHLIIILYEFHMKAETDKSIKNFTINLHFQKYLLLIQYKDTFKYLNTI